MLWCSCSSGCSIALLLPCMPSTTVPQKQVECVGALQRWVRQRCRQGGIPPPNSVHLVSSLKGRGVRELLQDLQALAGARQGLAAHVLGGLL